MPYDRGASRPLGRLDGTSNVIYSEIGRVQTFPSVSVSMLVAMCCTYGHAPHKKSGQLDNLDARATFTRLLSGLLARLPADFEIPLRLSAIPLPRQTVAIELGLTLDRNRAF